MVTKLNRLFKVGQQVKVREDGVLHDGTVSEIFEDHIIVDVPGISDHMWYEDGWNIGNVFPDYNFGGKGNVRKM